MERIKDFEILEEIGETRGSLIYRGRRSGDENTVIIKRLKTKLPSPSEIAMFRQEFDILMSLDIEGIIKPLEIINYEGGFVLILEDFDGISIKEFLIRKQIFEIEQFLKTGIKILKALGELHKRNIIHKDIKPSNILINLNDDIVKITDFGISTILTHENDEIYNPDVIQGSLLYISPEQTGRMNRTVDYRTDLYSLGVTFYKMLTGLEPFYSKDPLEIIHSHIAIEPRPPVDHNPEIPELISNIILKLLSKNAEDRYQNAFGVIYDFEECLRRVERKGKVGSFTLGSRDSSGKFIISEKLFGREHEEEYLISSFKNFKEKEHLNRDMYGLTGLLNIAEIMLVSGPPGIGKSSLINEINKPLTKMKGYFLSGKFEQFGKHVPYSALVQAFKRLIKQILTESDKRINELRQNIMEALGENGKIITDIIPELEYIIGKQPEVITLGPQETKNRFSLIFERFLRVFTKKQHPIVLFIDDLQWADLASLELIKRLITSPKIGYLYLIGSYRDNEVTESHPLTEIIKSIEEYDIKINRIVLSELKTNDIKDLISNLLKCDEGKAFSLAELIFKKTGGNPFFINEFLQSLYNENLIKMESDAGWTWDSDKIKSTQVTENLVRFISQKIEKFPEDVKKILKICACIGNNFKLEVVARLVERTVESTLELLTEAINDKVISINDDTFVFSHDRIQEAVYSLVPDNEKSTLHYMIGQLLLEITPPEELDKEIFHIVDQLNSAKQVITLSGEKEKLAGLNYDAGIKAKNSSAFSQAFKYFTTGIELINDDFWNKQDWVKEYNLILSLYTQAAETAYLNGNYDSMNHYAEIVFQKAKSLPDAIPVYEVKIHAFDAQLKFEESIDTCLDVLEKLNHPIPKYPGKIRNKISLLKIKPRLTYKKIDSLYNLPEIRNQSLLSLFKIFHLLTKSALYIFPDLYIYASVELVRLSMKYGLCKEQSLAYVRMANIMINVMGEVEAGYKLGQFALSIVERFNARDVEAGTLAHYYLHIAHWKEHLKTVREELLKSYQIGLETGDLENTALSLFVYDGMGTNTGADLAELEDQMHINNKILEQLKQTHIIGLHSIFLQMVLAFQGKSESILEINGTAFNKEENISQWKNLGALTILGTLYIYELFLKLVFNDYRGALIDANYAEAYLSSLIGGIAIRDFYFYTPLVRCALFDEASKKEKHECLKVVKRSLKYNRGWAIHAPMNYEARIYLLEAEKARILNKYVEAEVLYDRAIGSSRKNEHLVDEALANETAARYYINQNRFKIAKSYLEAAYLCYSRWGVFAKLIQIKEKFPDLLSSEVKDFDTLSETSSGSTTTGTKMPLVDFTAIVKSSQAISNEVVLEKLLDKMMKIVMENAGAEKGFLILKNYEKYFIEAEGSIKDNKITVLKSIPLEKHKGLSSAIVNYVARTNEMVILNNAYMEGNFTNDQFIKENKSKSILCIPISNQGKQLGMLYLGNDLSTGVFTSQRCEILDILSSQIAVSIGNAKFYERLEAKVRERTKELEKSERRFKDLIYGSDDWVWESNVLGQFTYCSEKVEDILGYKPEEVIGKRIYDFMPDDEKKRLQDTIGQIKNMEHGFKDIESWKLKKNGEFVYTITNGVPVFDSKGNRAGFRGVDKDITESKEHEIKIQNIMNELTCSNNELQQFAYIVSHDLQEPLRKIRTFGEKLRENTDFSDDDKNIDYVQGMLNAAERMDRLINDLLNYSRVTTMVQPFKDVDLKSIISEVQSDLEVRIKETGADFEIGDLPVISADSLQIMQLFRNLIGNALKFCKQDITPLVKIYSLNENKNGYCRVIVEDNGIGIDEKDFEKIFGIFQRLHDRSEFEGTGIGLAICKKIMKRHNGDVNVESSKGKGSKFILSFPVK